MKKPTIPTVPWRAPSLWSFKPYPLFVSVLTLLLFGVGDGMLLQSHLGNSPWTIFAEGLSLHTPLSVGMSSLLISVVILLLWLPLRIKPGLNTLLNAVLIAVAIDITRQWIPTPALLWQQIVLGLSGIVLTGISGAYYLSVNMGAGPRDGVMVALSSRLGISVAKIRTVMEVCACLIGWALGGTVGFGTIAFALCIGPVLGGTLRFLRHRYPQT